MKTKIKTDFIEDPLPEGLSFISKENCDLQKIVKNELTENLIIIDKDGDIIKFLQPQLANFKFLQKNYLSIKSLIHINIFFTKLLDIHEFKDRTTILIQDYNFSFSKIHLLSLIENGFKIFIIGD
jgi:hypothetical protein